MVIFNGTFRQIEKLNLYLNNLHPKIKFKNKIEINNSLNFFDLTIIKSSEKLEFNIFRKPTSTDVTINALYHPIQHKLAAYNSFANRLLTTLL